MRKVSVTRKKGMNSLSQSVVAVDGIVLVLVDNALAKDMLCHYFYRTTFTLQDALCAHVAGRLLLWVDTYMQCIHL